MTLLINLRARAAERHCCDTTTRYKIRRYGVTEITFDRRFIRTSIGRIFVGAHFHTS